jgi:hypothetical protein
MLFNFLSRNNRAKYHAKKPRIYDVSTPRDDKGRFVKLPTIKVIDINDYEKSFIADWRKK